MLCWRAVAISTLAATLLGALGPVAPLAAGGDPELETLSSAPEGISDGVRAALSGEGYRVLQDGEVLAEFWLCQEVPAGGEEVGALGIGFPTLTPGALVGVVHFPESWSDYRNLALPPGIYTLRYGVQPADGDHMGVSEYRDFLMLTPADSDNHAETVYEHDELVDLSRGASGEVHPAALGLFPIWDEVTSPQLVLNEIEQWTLAVPVGDLTLGLVILGHGELP